MFMQLCVVREVKWKRLNGKLLLCLTLTESRAWSADSNYEMFPSFLLQVNNFSSQNLPNNESDFKGNSFLKNLLSEISRSAWNNSDKQR